MTRKLFSVIALSIIVLSGIYLLASEKKNTGISSKIPSFISHQDTANEEIKEEMKKESYNSGISLQITQPKANATITTATITVKGKTAPKAEVFINEEETTADTNGNFSASISLEEGENPIVVVVNDDNGNSAEQQILVTRSQ